MKMLVQTTEFKEGEKRERFTLTFKEEAEEGAVAEEGEKVLGGKRESRKVSRGYSDPAGGERKEATTGGEVSGIGSNSIVMILRTFWGW